MKLDPAIKAYALEHKKEFSLFKQAIKRYDRIAIFRHIRPDFDAMGTQMGLYTFIKDNFPDKEVHFLGDNHVAYTPRIFPETERLNESWFKEPFLAIVTDVGDHERIADPRYRYASYICKVDHHPFIKEIARHPILDINKPAAAELMCDILLSWEGTVMSKEAARYFYIGIVGDSGRFQYRNTTGHTFAVAKALCDTGIDINSIYLEMYERKLDDLKSEAYILSNFHVSPHGVAYYILSDETLKELGITREQGKDNVNMFSNIEGVNAWCSVTEDKSSPKDYCWRVSIRSKRKDISGVANKWRGGGHALASGAKVKSLEELPLLIADLDALFE